jgi:hypothetical protein
MINNFADPRHVLIKISPGIYLSFRNMC